MASVAQVDDDQPWQTISPANGVGPTPRHESGLAAVEGRLWLFGGRGQRPVEVFTPGADRWRSATPAPVQLHHFQPAVIGQHVYIIGAFVGNYPDETPVAEIYRFDTRAESWSVVGVVPEARRRGSMATAVRNGWIYVAGGNTLGHNGGAVAWTDRWRPADDTWQTLSDAPTPRDHFSAGFVDGKLISAGGRATALPNPFANTIGVTDVYDPGTDSWSSAASIPTQRAGTLAIVFDGELIVAGGENTKTQASDAAEAFDIRANRWRELQPLDIGRHSGGGALLDDRFHVVAGSDRQGGGGETSAHEFLPLVSLGSPDSDNDGLSDDDERDIHGTDPDRADTDEDTLPDGEEVDRGTDPTKADSDMDGVDDPVELANGTDPVEADSDDDGLDDGDERVLGTDPLSADSDSDELSDGSEVTQHQTDPLRADSDNDGLDDGREIDLGTDPNDPDSDGDGMSDGDEVEEGRNPLFQEPVDPGSTTGEDTGADDGTGADTGGNTGTGTGTGTGAESGTADGTGDGTGDGAGDGSEGSTTGNDTAGSATGGDVRDPRKSGGASGGLLLLGLLGVLTGRRRPRQRR